MAKSKNTLIQRIALDGGEEIEKELKAIGAEGEAVFKKLKDGADALAKSGTGVNRFFAQIRTDLKTISAGSAKVRAGFDDISAGIAGVARNGTILVGVVAGITAGLIGLSKSASDAADEQGKAAASAGLDIKTYGRLQFAFEQGNVAAEGFQIGMKKFNVVLADAAAGGKKSAGLFASLGVSVTDVNGKLRPTEDILEDIADKFAKLPNGAQKSAISLQLFGKSGATFIPVLNDGSKAIKNLGDQMERTGNVFTDAQATIGDAFGDALNKVTKDITGIKNQIGITLAPAFTEAFDAISKIIEDNQKNITDFAKTITDQIIPVIKDFANALSGKDGAVVNKNILGIRDGFVKVGQAVLIVIDVLGTIFTILENTIQPLVDLYNNTLGLIFGKIDAQTALIVIAIGALTGVFRFAGLAIKGTSLALEGIGEIFGTVTAKVVAMVARILLIQGLLKTLVQDVVTTFTGFGKAIGDFFTGVFNELKKAFTDFGTFISDIFGGLLTLINNVAAAAKAALAIAGALLGAPQKDGISSSGKGGGGFASGGHVRGAGSGTSDSILARLSNGEFVIRASAVRRLGVSFLNSLNQGRANGFAMGGLVGGLRPAFGIPGYASGGLVDGGSSGSRTPINLHLGGEVFADLLAPVDIADKLVQYAMGQKVRSGGGKPTWKK